MTDRLIGARLGDYELRGLLGRGGMGSVYRGYDRAGGREVAIKVIGAGGLLPDAVERFRREGRLAGSLRHPNIVRVLGVGEQDGTLYMVQELLPGPSLAEQIRRAGKRRLPAPTVGRVIAQLASALDYAHARGVIHRDVKPGNALYNAAGDLVLTDFGLARDADVRATATGPGVVMGTPGYVAPEQAVSSRGVTKACDTYALGVLLFELLTGRLPFEADSPMGVILKHLYDEPPPPSVLRPELPAPVDAVVLRAMRKEPEARFASAGELAAALLVAWPEAREAAPRAQAVGARSSPAPALSPAPRRAAPGKAPAAVRKTPAPATAGSPPARAPEAPARRAPEQAARAARAPASELAAKAPAPAARRSPASKPIAASKAPAAAPPAAATKPAAAPPRPGGRMRLRVGLATACLVGALILAGFGLDVAAVGRGWQALIQLAGG